MADMHQYSTAISKIVSNEKDDQVIVRGHHLCDLVQNSSFAETVFLLITGRFPNDGQATTLDALFTACVDHGITPSAMIGRASASYGTNIQQAIASGVLLFGDIHGGAGLSLAHAMEAILGDSINSQCTIDDVIIADAARKIVKRFCRTDERVPGFGIPTHKADPRSPALLKVAQNSGTAGIYCQLLVAVECELKSQKGRPIPINLDGIVAALVLDLGFPAECATAFVMIARSFSTLAHHLEEKAQNTRWRHVPLETVTYTGSLPTNISQDS